MKNAFLFSILPTYHLSTSPSPQNVTIAHPQGRNSLYCSGWGTSIYLTVGTLRSSLPSPSFHPLWVSLFCSYLQSFMFFANRYFPCDSSSSGLQLDLMSIDRIWITFTCVIKRVQTSTVRVSLSTGTVDFEGLRKLKQKVTTCETRE